MFPSYVREVVERKPLAPGMAGLEQTLSMMTRAIREGSKNPFTIELAHRVVNRVQPHDHRGETKAIWDYFFGLEGFPYRRDPTDLEWVQGGPAMPRGGDCDCIAVRLGMLLEALGHEVEIVPIGVSGPPFHHVYLYDRTAKVTVDPVLHQPVNGMRAQVGDEIPHALELRRRVPMHARPTVSLSPNNPTQIVENMRARMVVRTQQGQRRTDLGVPRRGLMMPQITTNMRARRTDLGMPRGRQQLGGLFEDLIGGVKALGRAIDPTNKNAPLGNMVRTAISSIPGAGPTIVGAMDTAAAIRQGIAAATGTDVSKVTDTQAKVADAALAAGKSVSFNTSGATATMSVNPAPKPSGTEVKSAGLSTGAKVAIAAGAVAVGGGILAAVAGGKRRR